MKRHKAKARDGYEKFCKEFYKIDKGKLNDQQRSDGLTLFFITEIFNKLNPGVFPDDPEEVRDHIVDGKDDCDCDLIYKNDDQVYIIQTKYRKSSSKSEEEDEVTAFTRIHEKIHPVLGKDIKKNQPLTEALRDIDWKEDTINLIFLTFGKGNDAISRINDRGIQSFTQTELKDRESRDSFEFIDETELNIRYRDSLNPNDLPAISIRLHYTNPEKPYFNFEAGDNMEIYVGSMQSSQVHELYKKERSKLFNLNIRNYLGSNSTNKEIMNSAIKEPENFFVYNNGISAVAEEIEEDKIDDKVVLNCKNFSIINGAQTFRSIAKAYVNSSNSLKRPCSVMVRITKVPKLSTSKSLLIDNITKYNNTQNPVKLYDFRSNDAVQTSLRDAFKKESFQGKKFEYLNKRTEKPDRNKISIKLDNFCKYIFCFKFGPIDIYGGQKHLYNTEEDKGGYYFLFGDANEPLSENSIKSFKASWFFIYQLLEKFKSQKLRMIEREEAKIDDDDDRNFMKLALNPQLLIYCSGEIIRSHYQIFKRKNDETYDVYEEFDNLMAKSKFTKANWNEKENPSKFLEEIIEESGQMIRDTYINKYREASDGKFIHRNFFRERSTLELLKEKIRGNRHIAKLFEGYQVD